MQGEILTGIVETRRGELMTYRVGRRQDEMTGIYNEEDGWRREQE